MKPFAFTVGAIEYLKINPALYSLIGQVSRRVRGGSEKIASVIFRYLIHASGGIDAIMRGLGFKAYDDKFVEKLLRETEGGKVASFAVALVEAWKQLEKEGFSYEREEDYTDVYESKTNVAEEHQMLVKIIKESRV